ncbi:MAG: hypothetical protein J7L72_04395 [Candidatus Aminicenantes bacterium]|nr:hypothetical protein [Candidatus Aminicenantes bacterium]HHF51324.1 hypothetical protein [Candidatus Aminicenantes bacterium]
MKLRTKVAIFLLACFITFVGFSLIIPAGAVDMMKIGKTDGYKIISNVLFASTVKKPPSLKG